MPTPNKGGVFAKIRWRASRIFVLDFSTLSYPRAEKTIAPLCGLDPTFSTTWYTIQKLQEVPWGGSLEVFARLPILGDKTLTLLCIAEHFVTFMLPLYTWSTCIMPVLVKNITGTLNCCVCSSRLTVFPQGTRRHASSAPECPRTQLERVERYETQARRSLGSLFFMYVRMYVV